MYIDESSDAIWFSFQNIVSQVVIIVYMSTFMLKQCINEIGILLKKKSTDLSRCKKAYCRSLFLRTCESETDAAIQLSPRSKKEGTEKCTALQVVT